VKTCLFAGANEGSKEILRLSIGTIVPSVLISVGLSFLILSGLGDSFYFIPSLLIDASRKLHNNNKFKKRIYIF